jgi:hypothetical protein
LPLTANDGPSAGRSCAAIGSIYGFAATALAQPLLKLSLFPVYCRPDNWLNNQLFNLFNGNDHKKD